MRMQVHSWRSLVPQEVAQRFVRESASTFPMPRMTSRLVSCIPANSQHSKHPSAVMLIGDAAHSFPPGIVASYEL